MKDNRSVTYYSLYPEWKENTNYYLFDIARKGDIDLISFIIRYRNPLVKINYTDIAGGAAQGGHRDILERALRKGANNIYWIAKMAAKGGNLDIVTDMVNREVRNFDGIAEYAAEGGHLDIVKYAINNGATNYDKIAEGAATAGYLEIVKYILNTNISYFLQNPILLINISDIAHIFNHQDIVNYIREYQIVHHI
jgi:hypothetical protein